MSNMRKVVLPVMLAGMLMGDTIYAAPLNDQLKQQQSQLQQQSDALKGVKEKVQSLEENIDKLDANIQKTNNDINSNNQQIASTEKEIDVTNQQLKKAQDDLDNEIKTYGVRIRYMYINGNDNIVGTLLESKGFSDFLKRIQVVVKLSDLDKKMVADITSRKNEVNKKKQALSDKKEKIVSLKKDNEKKLASLSADKDSQQKLIAQSKAEEDSLNSKISNSQAQIMATANQIEALKSSVPRYDPAKGSAPYSDNAVVVFAYQYLGRPYVWGATGPTTFDCSGFTQFIYRHFGISIGRTTYDQIKDGSPVADGDLRPGDLIFFGTWSDPHHVGMYVGNGTYIHAPHTGDVVKLSVLSGRDDYLTARRIK